MITENKKQALELFAAGRKLYKMMQFAEAQEKFTDALKADPSDNPSKVYKERCAYYLANPPAEDWDGVFTMTTK
jgi:tetratricopeptide (TPR) repeat protein